MEGLQRILKKHGPMLSGRLGENQDPSDNSFVFSDKIIGSYIEMDLLVAHLADLISHEAGHLLGYLQVFIAGEGFEHTTYQLIDLSCS